MKFVSCFLLLLTIAVGPAFATNTTSVFSPEVTPGSRSLEYRFSITDEPGPDSWAHRLHYQQAINDTWRWRLIGAFADPGGAGHEFRYGRLEIQQQYLESETAGWDAAIRYELQIADGDDEPSRARIAWTGRKDFDHGLQLRGNILTGREFGPYASDGWLLELRSQATYPVHPSLRVGVEMFNDFNDSQSFGSYGEQGHQIGPVIKGKIGEDWEFLASWLFGISKNADDHDFRLHIIRSF